MPALRAVFLLLPDLEILDLAGPLQALTEANQLGGDYEIVTCAPASTILSDQKILFADLKPLVDPRKDDLIFVPGIRFAKLGTIASDVLDWLRRAAGEGAKFYSICTGAFVLGEAGLLDGKECTTHWTRTRDMQNRFPRARVIENRLYVTDGAITTSAGIAAGIDLALAVIEQNHDPKVAAAVAREMVVYMRRDGSEKQESVYMQYRSHVHDGIHRVQDILVREPEKRHTLARLADIANMSERNLTRVFRKVTGISIGDYTNKLRLEMVMQLLPDPTLNLEAISLRCGFESSRQLRRLAKQHLGARLSALRDK